MMKFFIAATALLVAAAAPALAQDRTNRGMMRYDTNGDGFVDRAEWAAGQEARFRQLDTDKDGKLSQDELFARTPAAGRNVVPDDRQVQRQARFFRQVDSDKDGFVSKAEFLAQAERNFVRCDLDKDGRINTAECRHALQRKPADKARLER